MADIMRSETAIHLKNPHLVGVWFILLTQLADFNIGVLGTLCNKIQIVETRLCKFDHLQGATDEKSFPIATMWFVG